MQVFWRICTSSANCIHAHQFSSIAVQQLGKGRLDRLREQLAAAADLKQFAAQNAGELNKVVLSILKDHKYSQASNVEEADVVLLNTCAIRENAETRVWGRLSSLQGARQERKKQKDRQPLVVGVLGCMAERLKDKLLDQEKLADIVAGPDAYRDLPRLIEHVQGGGGSAINTQLSLEETYADITPLRSSPNSPSAFLSIMRGCNNMCAFCIVPYTRGRERSRPAASVLAEVRQLADAGVREVVLLGQNVNSYADWSERGGEGASTSTSGRDEEPYAPYARGFRSVYRPERGGAVAFAELLSRVAEVDPEMRIRFTSPHPKDFSDDVLQAISAHANVCQQLHMPAQSGSSSVLERMRRGYTRTAYDELVEQVRRQLPGVALSTDMIVGFCGETEEEHTASIDLMQRTGFDNAFLFAYSQRGKTHAARHLPDDVPQAVKDRRLQEALSTFKSIQAQRNQDELGALHLVLVEGPAKKPPGHLFGKTCTMKKVVLPDTHVPPSLQDVMPRGGGQAPAAVVGLQRGDYVAVRVVGVRGGTLLAEPLARSGIREFVDAHGSTTPGAAKEQARSAYG